MKNIEDSVPSISSFLCVTIINQNHEIISLASWQHLCGIKKMHLVSHYTTLVTLLIHWYKKTWTIWVQKVKQQVFIIVSDSIWFHYPIFFYVLFYKTRRVFRNLSNMYGGVVVENSEQLSVVNYFRKKLHHRCLTGSSILLWNLCSKLLKHYKTHWTKKDHLLLLTKFSPGILWKIGIKKNNSNNFKRSYLKN